MGVPFAGGWRWGEMKYAGVTAGQLLQRFRATQIPDYRNHAD